MVCVSLKISTRKIKPVCADRRAPRTSHANEFNASLLDETPIVVILRFSESKFIFCRRASGVRARHPTSGTTLTARLKHFQIPCAYQFLRITISATSLGLHASLNRSSFDKNLQRSLVLCSNLLFVSISEDVSSVPVKQKFCQKKYPSCWASLKRKMGRARTGLVCAPEFGVEILSKHSCVPCGKFRK